MSKIQRFQLIDTLVPANSTATRFFINDQPNLRFVSLHNLEAYSFTTNSIVSGNPIITSSFFNSCTLVLYFNDRESIKNIPLNVLNTTNYGIGQALRNTFAGQQIIWSKSYFQLGDNSVNPSQNESILLGVYYS